MRTSFLGVLSFTVMLLAVALPTGGCGGGSTGGEDPPGPLNVMLLHAWDDPTGREADVIAKLEALGLVVVNFDGGAATPTLGQLQSVDAVLCSSDLVFLDGAALGNVLADYVDAGGALVVAVFSTQFGIDGRYDSADYRAIPEAPDQSGDGPITLGATTTHPILTGVTTISGGSQSFRALATSIHPQATLVASWSDGTPLVAIRTDLGGRRADVNLYPPTDDVASGWQSAAGDGIRLLANALSWVAGRL